ncbi:MAG: DNA-binding protein [Chloroflexi bacterium]|nr:DNA-binding protein [Chloroflexota bacterium]
MAIPAEVLRRVGITENPRLFEQVVSEALTTVLGQRYRTDPVTNLTASERDALRRGGMDLTTADWGKEDPLLRTAAEYAVLIASAYPVNRAAELLGVEPSRIRQRLAARTLYGIKERGTWRLPRFQFPDGCLVPNISVVFARLRDGLHPVGVWRWFTTANPDLPVGEDETPVSPLEWLRAGLDPGPVADLAAEL